MTQVAPKRIVLRFHEKYDNEIEKIFDGFLKEFGIDPTGDYFPELFPPSDSSKMHYVIDLNCKLFPSVNLDEIPYEVYRVKKKDEFTFEKLGFNAPDEARARCSAVRWGRRTHRP